MKITTQKLKQLIKEELEEMEQEQQASGEKIYLIMENAIDYTTHAGLAYRSKEAAVAKVAELEEANPNPFASFDVVTITLM